MFMQGSMTKPRREILPVPSQRNMKQVTDKPFYHSPHPHPYLIGKPMHGMMRRDGYTRNAHGIPARSY